MDCWLFNWRHALAIKPNGMYEEKFTDEKKLAAATIRNLNGKKRMKKS